MKSRNEVLVRIAGVMSWRSLYFVVPIFLGLSCFFASFSLVYCDTDTIEVGKQPHDISINPLTNRLYVSNYQSHSVSVLDGLTRTRIHHIETGNYPSEIAVNSNMNTIYVANKYNIEGPGYSAIPQISVINGSTNRIMSNFSGLGIKLVSPITGNLYIQSSINGTDIVNPSTYDIITTLKISNVTDSVFDDKAGIIYFIDESSNLYAVNSNTNVILNQTKLEGYSLTAIDIDNSGQEIYITGRSNIPNRDGGVSPPTGVLLTLDAQTKNITSELEIISPSDVIVSPKTGEIYVTNSFSGEVSLIDGKTKNVVNGPIAVGNFPQKLAWNPVDQSVYVVNTLSNSVSVISK